MSGGLAEIAAMEPWECTPAPIAPERLAAWRDGRTRAARAERLAAAKAEALAPLPPVPAVKIPDRNQPPPVPRVRRLVLHAVDYLFPATLEAIAERVELSEELVRQELEAALRDGLVVENAHGFDLTVEGGEVAARRDR